MSIELLIKQIVDLDRQIEADIETVNIIEKDGVDFRKTERYEERIPTLIETQDKLKRELANRIIEAYTGYHCQD